MTEGKTCAGNSYLLLGPETGEKNELIARLRESLSQKSGGEPDEYVFYPYDTDVSEIISVLANIPLFAPSKFVTIRNCHDLKKKDISLIAGYLKNPAENTLLVLVSDNVRADPSLEKLFTGDRKKIFWEMFDNRKKGWVVRFFQKRNIAVESSAVDFLVDMLEGDTETLKRECENLALFFDQQETITEERIGDFFYSRKEDNTFSLFSHIAKCDFGKAVEASANIFLSGDSNPVQVLGGILWQVRILHSLKRLMDKKTAFQEACAKLNIRTKKMQSDYSEAAQNYTLMEIEQIISLIAWYDFLFRSSRMEIQQIMFPVFIYSVIICKGRNIDQKGLSRNFRYFP